MIHRHLVTALMWSVLNVGINCLVALEREAWRNELPIQFPTTHMMNDITCCKADSESPTTRGVESDETASSLQRYLGMTEETQESEKRGEKRCNQ